MKFLHFFSIVFFCLIFTPVPARTQSEDVPFESGETSLLVGTPHPALFSDFKVEGFDYLEASLAVEDQGATVTWAPFLLPRRPGAKYTHWSETRFQLSQKEDVTSIGISFKINPLNPLSKNGGTKWEEYWAGVAPQRTLNLELTSAKKLRRKELRDLEFEELTLQKDSSCSRYLTLTEDPPRPNQPSKLDSLLQEVLEARIDLASDSLLYRIHCALAELKPARADLQAEIEQIENSATFGNEGDGATEKQTELERQKTKLEKWNGTFVTLLPIAERAYIRDHKSQWGMTRLMAIRAEIAALDQAIAQTESGYAVDAFTGYREKLYSSRKPIINLSYIHSFFNIIGGSRVDEDEDGLRDNEHDLKSRSLSLTFDWRLGERDGLSLLFSYSTERLSAEEGAPVADYVGFGGTWSHVLTILNKDGFKKTKEYRESLFVPMIAFGLAYEWKDCSSPNPDCPEGITRTQAFTPFVDFKLMKSAQFRIGIPFKRNRIFRMAAAGADEDSIDIVSLFAIQLGAPD